MFDKGHVGFDFEVVDQSQEACFELLGELPFGGGVGFGELPAYFEDAGDCGLSLVGLHINSYGISSL